MKSFWNALAIVLLINVLLALGGMVYLYMGGRLNADRVRAVAAIFTPTIEQQQALERRTAEQAALDAERARRQAHQQKVADGPVSTLQQIGRDQNAEEIALLQVQRLREEIRVLQRQLEMARQAVAMQKAEQDQEKLAWQASIADELARREDEDFQKTVQLYQQVKPRQAKDMFLQRIAAGESEQVVEYLAAMQPRKAAGILKEFRNAEELVTASELLERLRQRGTQLPQSPLPNASSDDTPANDAIGAARSGVRGELG